MAMGPETAYIGEIAAITIDGKRVGPTPGPRVFLPSGWDDAYVPRKIRKGLRFLKIGKVVLFKTACPTPLVYSTNNLVVARQSRSLQILGQKFLCGGAPLATMVARPSVAMSRSRSTVRIVGKGAGYYDVNIRSNGPTLLVFSDTFDPNWNLFRSNGRPISAEHIVADGFENGWFLNKKINGRISIRYTGQSRLDFVFFFGALSLLAAFSLMFYDKCSFQTKLARLASDQKNAEN